MDVFEYGTFAHQFYDGQKIELPAGKIVCIGRNYAAHAKELNNPVPTEPVLFIKPNTSLQPLEPVVQIPSSDCHFETELAVLIGSRLNNASETEVRDGLMGYTLALDLTRRAKQSQLKEKSLPWECAKAFDGACPLGAWIPADQFSDEITFSLHLNEQLQQSGTTKDMLNPVLPLISYISQIFTLMPGDVVLTGTPAGVGELSSGDDLRLLLDNTYSFHSRAQS